MKTETDIELAIDSLGARGDGIAAFEDERVFVPYAAPGDRLTARLARDGDGRLIGRIRDILAPGPSRAAPPCPHFGIGAAAGCGGCTLQHIDGETYRAWKMEQLAAALARFEIAADEIEPLAVSPPASRRRADLTASRRKEGVTLGFNARASHRIVDLHACAVLRPALAALLDPLRELLAALLRTGDGAELKLTASDSGVDILLVTSGEIGRGGRERVAAFAARHDLARVARGHPRRPGAETLIERRPVRMMLGGVPVPMPPGAFLQATAEGEAALRDFVVGAAKGARRIADLYAGIGTFTFPLAAGRAKVHAIDSGRAETAAIAAAARAAVLPGVTAEQRDLAKRPLEAGALGQFDAIVFDPPRAGATELVERVVEAGVETVIAISCNPASFARDARSLLDGGYRLVRLRPVDQFLWSTHLELAALFLR